MHGVQSMACKGLLGLEKALALETHGLISISAVTEALHTIDCRIQAAGIRYRLELKHAGTVLAESVVPRMDENHIDDDSVDINDISFIDDVDFMLLNVCLNQLLHDLSMVQCRLLVVSFWS